MLFLTITGSENDFLSPVSSRSKTLASLQLQALPRDSAAASQLCAIPREGSYKELKNKDEH